LREDQIAVPEILKAVLEKLAAGETNDVILVAYSQLRQEHIQAGLECSASGGAGLNNV